MIKKLLISILSTFIMGFLGSPFLQAQTVYTFTTGGADGPIGPTQAQLNTAYAATNLAGNVTSTAGVQTWTVPVGGKYKIEAFGGQGYGSFGGRGAQVSGEFTLNTGTVLKIIVGQKAGHYYLYPATTYNHQFGGGGGSFVTSSTNAPYIVAGGGGGSHAASFITTCDGQVTTGGAGGVGGSALGNGGTNGQGGATASSADGGGGLLTDGGGTNGGKSFVNGGLGGNGNYAKGGFGGGGGTSSYNNYRAGGGGGYSGGGAANNGGTCCPSAGGGGSYNSGTNQISLAGVQTGNGSVVITKIPPVPNDAGVVDITSPVDNCDGLVQDVEVIISNLGSNQITSLEVHWTLNSVAQTVFNWSGVLDTANGTGQDSANVVIGSIALTAGASDNIVAWTEKPNNSADLENANDTSNASATGFNFPAVNMIVIPRNTLCFGSPFEFRANSSNLGSTTMYQWKINTVNSGTPTSNNKFSPSLMYGDSVNVDLITDYCDTAAVVAPSNYITMYLNPEPKLISGSTATDTVLENTSSNYLVPVVTGSTFTWSAVGGAIASPVGNAVTVDWGTAMDTAKIMATEKDAGNCSYTNVRKVFVMSIVGVKDENNLVGIGYAYPNPANTTVTIPVVIDGNWDIDLNLFDITGKKVKSIYNGEISGNKNFTFDVEDLDNGMYFYKISTRDGYESVKKLSIKH